MENYLKERGKLNRYLIIVILIAFLIGLYFIGVSLTGYIVLEDKDQTSFDLGTYEETQWNDTDNLIMLNWSDYTVNTTYATQGNFTSRVLDALVSSVWNNISWSANSSSNANVSFQVRSCNQADCSDGTFVGPDNTSSTYFENSTLEELNETLTPNSTYFQYKAFFKTDNETITPELYNITISATHIFSLSPDYPPDNQWLNTSFVTFNYTFADDNPDTCELWGNWSGSFVFNQSTTTITSGVTNNFTNLSLEDGVYLWGVFCNDTDNNQNWSANRTLGIDTITPTNVSIIAPVNNTITTNQTPFLNWTDATEINLNTYTIEADDSKDFDSIDYRYNTTISEYQVNKTWIDKRWYWRVLVDDLAGNVNESSEINTYIIDLTAPTVTLGEPADGERLTYTKNLSTDFRYVPINSNLDTCELWGDWGGIFRLNESHTNITSGVTDNFTLILPGGTYTWNVRCNDSVGNENFADENYTVTISITAPDVWYVATGGGGFAGRRETLIAIDIISPEPITVVKGDEIIAPITVKNTGEVVLHGISLEAVTESPGLTVDLTRKSIDKLRVDQEVALEMRIRTSELLEAEVNTIHVKARVRDPDFTDVAKFFVNAIDIGIELRKVVVEKIEFLRNLLDKTPECLQLMELLEAAEIEFDAKNYDKALEISKIAIESCKDISTLELRKLEKPKKPRFTLYIVLLETIIFLVIFSYVYRCYKRRRMSKSL